MVYQTLKYFLARIGLTVILMSTVGFLGLFLLHEIMLPQLVVNDKEVQWGLLGICMLVAWMGHGMVGEIRMISGLRKLKDIGLNSDENVILGQFKKMFALTYSSCFLPGKGAYFRQQVIHRYADYLLSLGKEDKEALNIYVKAFLQDPQNASLRSTIIAILSHQISQDTGTGIQPRNLDEIDLLLDLIKLDNYKDTAISNLLAGYFLNRQEFSTRSEPLFIRVVEHHSPNTDKIVQFVVPHYLRKARNDSAALKFYLRALDYDLEGREDFKKILAGAYYGGGLKVTEPQLHEQCAEVFLSLDKSAQESVARLFSETAISSSTKTIPIVNREDRASLKKIHVQVASQSATTPETKSPGSIKRGLYGLIFVDLGLKLKLAFILLVLVLAGSLYKHYAGQQKPIPQPPIVVQNDVVIPQSEGNGGKVYTVQIAAVFVQSQSKKIIDSMTSQGVEGLYVVESPKATGGKWYKIRFGKFSNKEEAQKIAEDLMQRKVIKNYFVLTIKNNDQ